MDIDFSSEQLMLVKAAREFVTRNVPIRLVREMEKDPRGFTAEIWPGMADLGWMGCMIPEEYDGVGDTFLNLAVLLEEMGRACLPGPFFSTVILGAVTLINAGSDTQKRDILPSVAMGETILTMALTEASAGWDAANVTAKAVKSGDGYVINGTKEFVPDAHVADRIICVTRTGEGADPDAGITLFLVDAKTPGITINPLQTMAGDKQCEVIFDDVKVSSEDIIGEVDKGWPVVAKTLQYAAVGKCLEMVGAARKALEMAVEYATQRVQFGKPIGTFQAIQHHCANMATDVEGSRLLTYKAAWMLSEGLPCEKEVAQAKAFVSNVARKVLALSHQVHGAIGYTQEHDLQLYYRRVKAAELAYGDAYYHACRAQAAMGI